MDSALRQSALAIVDWSRPPQSEELRDHPAAGFLLYGAYSELTLEHPGGNPPSEAERARSRSRLIAWLAEPDISTQGEHVSLPRISNLSTTDHATADIACMVRWWDIEPQNSMGLAAAAPDQFAQARRHIGTALDHLAAAAPGLHAEFATIIGDIVVAVPDGTELLRYDAGSSFALWGSCIVNAARHEGWPRYCKSLVHEEAHNLLFAIAREEPLVANDPGERYSSPLRNDPRPMDGIFHAAFVSARECLAFESLLAWHERTGSLCSEDRRAIEGQLEDSVIGFWQCSHALRDAARLTELGRSVLDACETYMTRNFALVPA